MPESRLVPETNLSSQRLLSLDFLRGFIMVSLMIGETGFFRKLSVAFPNSVTNFFAYQFEHSSWHGLRFWDVILPGFMLIAGTSLAYSFKRQQELGYSWNDSFRKTLKRSFWLLFWGILIYAVRDGHLNFQMSNVLTQLSFTTLIANTTRQLIALPAASGRPANESSPLTRISMYPFNHWSPMNMKNR